MFRKIVVAFDESPEAERAFRSALELARLAGAQLSIVTVIESLPAYISYAAAVSPDVPSILQSKRRDFYENLQGKAIQEAKKAGIELNAKIVEGDEVGMLVDAVREMQPDLFVIGFRKEPAGFGRLFGGTAHQLAMHTKCDVLGVR